jgi:LmbE family N-acetylglucosaminyl deacetylase
MRSIVIATYPGDKVLDGCGTRLRRKAEGVKVAWLNVTSITVQSGCTPEKVTQRTGEINRVKEQFGFDEVFSLNFPAAQIDRISISDLVSGISDVFKQLEPEEVLLHDASDVRTDHRVVFDAAGSCTEWFRYPSVKRVLPYETLSESDFGLGANHRFRPKVFVDIAPFFDEKLRAMARYASELVAFTITPVMRPFMPLLPSLVGNGLRGSRCL